MHAHEISICRKDDRDELAPIVEPKALYRLTFDTTRDDLREVSSFKGLVNRLEKEDERAKAKVMVAFTQTYNYVGRSWLVHGTPFPIQLPPWEQLMLRPLDIISASLSVCLEKGNALEPEIPLPGQLFP